MAITYNKIIESTTEPATNNLWLKDGKLYYYKGGWKPLTSEDSVDTEDLKMLMSEYSDGRQAIATALTNRKYPTEPSESFHSMADKITNMNYEEGWFAKIGYTKENDGGIQDAINYSYELAKGWNPDGSTALMFNGNTELVFLPPLDWSNVNKPKAFAECSSLSFIGGELDLMSCTNIEDFFLNCKNLKEIIFRNSYNNKSLYRTFNGCVALKRIKKLDVASVTTGWQNTSFLGVSRLVYLDVRNLGKSTLTTYDFSGASVWGTGSEENRQSLIDSLITYSYDRASNGMETATIKLSVNTKALLTEEEIAQITAKGFTIA